MRYVYECDNMHPGCDESFEGETAEEVMADAVDHERESHGPDVSAETLARVKDAVSAGPPAAT